MYIGVCMIVRTVELDTCIVIGMIVKGLLKEVHCDLYDCKDD